MNPAPFYLCGPTASGKSSLAIALAQRCNGEIVNADAYQLYQGLETITAAPSDEEQQIVQHHLYSVLSPSSTCDAQRYIDMAHPVIEDIIDRGKTPIITGGSGLYLKFLTHGPAPLPTANDEVRERLDAMTLDELLAELKKNDPADAARIESQNRRYLTRSLEIFLLTGKPASEQRDAWITASALKEQSLRGIFIQVPRDQLHQRIEQRCKKMLDAGAIDEVQHLRHQLSDTSEKAIGIPQIIAHLNGEIDYATCLQKMIEATRQYAKRQETWFRKEKWLQAIPLEKINSRNIIDELMATFFKS